MRILVKKVFHKRDEVLLKKERRALARYLKKISHKRDEILNRLEDSVLLTQYNNLLNLYFSLS